jgi:hypothetical protein
MHHNVCNKYDVNIKLQLPLVWLIVTEWPPVSIAISCHVAHEFCLQLGVRLSQHKADNIACNIKKSIQ